MAEARSRAHLDSLHARALRTSWIVPKPQALNTEERAAGNIPNASFEHEPNGRSVYETHAHFVPKRKDLVHDLLPEWANFYSGAYSTAIRCRNILAGRVIVPAYRAMQILNSPNQTKVSRVHCGVDLASRNSYWENEIKFPMLVSRERTRLSAHAISNVAVVSSFPCAGPSGQQTRSSAGHWRSLASTESAAERATTTLRPNAELAMQSFQSERFEHAAEARRSSWNMSVEKCL